MAGIGFSTGSLAKSDVGSALRLLEPTPSSAIELSALRTHELEPLIRTIPLLRLDQYDHVSVHAPSIFTARQEPDIAAALFPLAQRGWLIILHPDAIHDFGLWTPFADRLCVENMDRRKSTGRTVEELQPVFSRLPEASFCFDVAHAFQCDSSMGEALRQLDTFADRLREVHVSELDTYSRHVRLSPVGVWACQRVSGLIPLDVPVIIEAPVRPDEICAELEVSLEALGRLVSAPCAA